MDPFHWLKRWNKVLVDPNSAQAGIFHGLMSHALFVVEPAEYKQSKEKLQQKKKRVPLVKEILREANSTIPEPLTLRSDVEAVLHYLQTKDSETIRLLSLRREDDRSPKPKLFMKQWLVQNVFRKQLVHVDKGCLSDPSSTVVNIFRRNTKSDITYVARGTNTNE